MASEVAQFAVTIQRVREGSQDAAWDLIQRYSPEIFRAVRRRLPGRLRGKFDSQDFVQAAWASVFAHRSRLQQFTQPDQFVAYMAAIAGNKVGMEVRRRLDGRKYNISDEQSLNDSVAGPPDQNDNGPTPSQVAVARERWFRLLAEQPTHYREIIKLRYQGETYRTIAEKLGFDERTVRRAMRRILRDQEV